VIDVEKLLDGAVDLHVHPYPSPFPRRMDASEAAQRAADAGMRAIVVKSHHHDTAMDVAALREHGIDRSGIQVFGGIALNTQVGGFNPHAVNLCLAMGGRVVWMPTIASPAHIAHHADPNLRFPALAVPLIPEQPLDVWANGEPGELRREVHEILKMIAEADAVLASGHLPPASIIAVFEAARDAGVRRMIVNHPNFVIEASKDEVRTMVELGAVIEHSLCMYDEESSFCNWRISSMRTGSLALINSCCSFCIPSPPATPRSLSLALESKNDVLSFLFTASRNTLRVRCALSARMTV